VGGGERGENSKMLNILKANKIDYNKVSNYDFY